MSIWLGPTIDIHIKSHFKFKHALESESANGRTFFVFPHLSNSIFHTNKYILEKQQSTILTDIQVIWTITLFNSHLSNVCNSVSFGKPLLLILPEIQQNSKQNSMIT